MTNSSEKTVGPSQLSFDFIGDPQSSTFHENKSYGVVTQFVSRGTIAIRREAIENVKRDGIFSVLSRKKS
jgi:hypothetical protein